MKQVSEIIEKVGLPRLVIALLLLVLFILAPGVEVSIARSLSDILARFGMTATLVLAMVPMVQSGCGLNFGIQIGIIAGLLGSTFAMNVGLHGVPGFCLALIVTIALGTLFGLGYGALLNRVKGSEMTIALYVGWSVVAFMCIWWLLLPYKNPVMIWGYGGEGLRTTITTEGYWQHVLDDAWAIRVGSKFKLDPQILAKLEQQALPAEVNAKLAELVEQETTVSFLLTPKSLEGLRTEGVSDEILDSLGLLVNQKFTGKQALLAAVKQQSDKARNLDQDVLFKYAENEFMDKTQFVNTLETALGKEGVAQYGKLILAYAKAGEAFKFPTGTMLFIALLCGGVWAFFHTKTGTAVTAVGSNPEFARASGISMDRMRLISVVISTVLGGIGILLYQQSFGFIQLYLAPLWMSFPAVAAILIGGASIHKATITNVIVGTLLYQGIVAMTPSVINSLIQSDISDVIRIISTHGIILYALTMTVTTKGKK